MASFIIPTQATPFYNLRTTLDGTDYDLHFRYNSRELRWYFDVFSKEGDPLLYGNKIICFYPLLDLQTQSRDLPPGFFYCPSSTGDLSPPKLNELGPGRRCKLVYFPANV